MNGKEKIYLWDDISLRVFEWRPNPAMATSLIQFLTTGKLPLHLNIPKGIQSELPQQRK